MSWLLIVLTSLIVITLIILYFFPQLLYPKVVTDATGPYSLNKLNEIFPTDVTNKFRTLDAATFQGFFYIIPLQRTPTALPCNTPGNPSCEDGRFARCPCGADSSCSSCVRNGYIALLTIPGALRLELIGAPDAGRQGKAMAQLAIYTMANQDASGNYLDASGNVQTAAYYVETIPLPSIPLQKWVMITISREGRRYDVYYDNQLVVSKKTEFDLNTTDATTPTVIGNPGFYGNAGLCKLYSTLQRGPEVAAVYASSTDTRGAPYLLIDAPTSVTSVSSAATKQLGVDISPTAPTFKLPSLCPSGACVAAPSFRPAQPWLDWETSYA